jgi:hypothetical protein
MTKQNPNAPLEDYEATLSRQEQWMNHLETNTPTHAYSTMGVNWESGVHGSCTFRKDAAPNLDEVEGGFDPDSYE